MDAVIDNPEPISDPKEIWPSVDLAYDLAIKSYEVAERRLNQIEGRIEKLLTFTASLTFAAPVLVKSLTERPNFGSWFFLGSLALFAFIMILGICTRSFGTIITFEPRKLYNEWLHLSTWEFKKNMTYFAGQHFDTNSARINKKGDYADKMAIALVAQLILLLIWTIYNLGQFSVLFQSFQI